MGVTSLQDQKPKATSYAYGEANQRQMMNYCKESKIPSELNHEYLRVVFLKQTITHRSLYGIAIPKTKDHPTSKIQEQI